ncbi:MAG: tRNA (adenosine(37)-N6)-threonylcarbamoyltransferase complex dimerization subunit type 1 TsaB [candidate division WOR-3 bacterium]|nr:MAG: tRNA (adenosine(37)-N6)-threonylcarbamoyltransferase complex dimerization subunit type 1 TsaB [candidate division WOR-3 bacterium]
MKILGIETSSPVFSLCLNDDETVLHEYSRRREVDGYGDVEIFNEARKILDSVADGELGAIAVSIGPGNFTSLRIGLSLAKGLALVKETPVVAVNSLDVIGLISSLPDLHMVAVVNAYRGEIYAAVYDSGKRVSDYLLTTAAELMQMMADGVVIVGPGIDIIADIQPRPSGIVFNKDERYLPRASRVVSAGLPRIRNRDFDNIEFLEPFYIKKTDAERNYDKGNAP